MTARIFFPKRSVISYGFIKTPAENKMERQTKESKKLPNMRDMTMTRDLAKASE